MEALAETAIATEEAETEDKTVQAETNANQSETNDSVKA